VIIINVAGYFYDKKEVTRQITGQIEAMIGGDTASDIQSIIDKASETKGTLISSILGMPHYFLERPVYSTKCNKY
jgi:membrane protein